MFLDGRKYELFAVRGFDCVNCFFNLQRGRRKVYLEQFAAIAFLKIENEAFNLAHIRPPICAT